MKRRRTRGKSTTFRRPKRSRLGLWTGVGVAILIAGYVAVLAISQPHVRGEELSLTDFIERAQELDIVDATILDVDGYVVGRYVDDGGRVVPYNTPYLKENTERLLGILIGAKIPTTIDQQNGKRAASLASVLIPGLILVLLFLYLILSYRRGTGLFNVRSGAQRVGKEAVGVTFADIAGQDAAIAEVREIAEFLSDPSRFTDLGATIPKGVLLYGPPGCGKTLLARALAGEAGASFFSISGSDFVELYAGVGAARVRDLFRLARESAPAIVFIDELDAVGRSRAAANDVVGSSEQEQALNQILTAMDGFSRSEGIIVVGATNRPDVLDPALLRPGRFDRAVGLERPDEQSRVDILRLHAQGKRLDAGVDLEADARRAFGMTGADLASVMNEAALLAGRAGKAAITQAELDTALQRILEAPERQRRLSLGQRSIGRRSVSDNRVTFADVAGADDAVEELTEIKEYLANPDRFADMGAQIPRGILLSGPPGCGKTLLARAIAGEANAAFFSVAASEFTERLVGVGAARVRDLFAEARAVAPAIVFIDEIDAVGAARRAAGGGTEEQEQTLNQLLIELDGFTPRAGILVVGATNRPDLLDPALRRPGRFDRHIAVSLPDRAGRKAVLALHARGKRLGVDVDLATVAGLTRGFSGADLANVLNEAALLAARKGLRQIPMPIVDEAIDRAMLGVASRAVVLSEDERRLVAYHEAGHALVAYALPGSSVPHKVTIVGRGSVLGQCSVLDAHDRLVHARSTLIERMAVALGGRVAEVLLLGEPASASGDDLRRVGELARHMVAELGMSDDVGPVGGSDAQVDEEVRRLAMQAQNIASEVLGQHRLALDRIAEALLDRETLTAAELESLVR
ncbi:MAG: AAA family ATPase [Acidimicrobiales bacterium]